MSKYIPVIGLEVSIKPYSTMTGCVRPVFLCIK